jgi:MOSC domain-containing protein YiiM
VNGGVVIGGTANDVSGAAGALDFVVVSPVLNEAAENGCASIGLASLEARVSPAIAKTAPAPNEAEISFTRFEFTCTHSNLYVGVSCRRNPPRARREVAHCPTNPHNSSCRQIIPVPRGAFALSRIECDPGVPDDDRQRAPVAWATYAAIAVVGGFAVAGHAGAQPLPIDPGVPVPPAPPPVGAPPVPPVQGTPQGIGELINMGNGGNMMDALFPMPAAPRRRFVRCRWGRRRHPIGRFSPRPRRRKAGAKRPHYADVVAKVLSVNLARVRVNPDAPSRSTGIDKAAVTEAVLVRAPGPMRSGLGSGLVGDSIGNQKLHGGDDQAVYVYAREDLDAWETHLERTLTNGMFGENFTTSGIDVTKARIGERWRVGTEGLLLEVSAPRTPCRTFSAFLQINRWIKTFTEAAKPGAYLRVISPGTVRAGDAIAVEFRPDHDVTIDLVFRARMSDPELLPQLLAADALSSELKAYVRRKVASDKT